MPTARVGTVLRQLRPHSSFVNKPLKLLLLR